MTVRSSARWLTLCYKERKEFTFESNVSTGIIRAFSVKRSHIVPVTLIFGKSHQRCRRRRAPVSMTYTNLSQVGSIVLNTNCSSGLRTNPTSSLITNALRIMSCMQSSI